ncbi:MAG TPA: hypothetical protein DEH78_15860 [Solibacterales bacterium]|nr:hypothetical protein [Bryobacterales bacterium]
MLYCQAVLPRAGLGNKLFPWARCLVFSRTHDVPMLATSWSQFSIGPLLRGQQDWRTYHNLFRNGEGDIGGLRRLWILNRAASVAEPEGGVSVLPEPGRAALVTFSGMGKHFGPLYGHHQKLGAALRALTRPPWVARADAAGGGTRYPVGIHVRLGDFSVPQSEDEMKTKGCVRTPLSWFISSLNAIRREAGWPVPAFVVSDGSAAELAPLLSLDDVCLVNTGSSIGDMLLLSKASILIATGGSSFSGWAAFLGQMPVIAHPGQNLAWFQLRPANGQFLGEFDPSAPDDAFLQQAAGILGRVAKH